MAATAEISKNIVNTITINSEVHFVGYLYIMDLINAWKMQHITIH